MAGSSRRSLFLIVFVLALFGLLGMLFAQRISPATTPSSDSDVRDSMKQFTEVYETIEQNYADPVNADKAIYNGAIPSMLHQLDPHSNFFDPKSYALLREEQSGKYYGVGMQVGPRNNKVIVIAPFAGAPAYRAGIRPGDIIVAVDEPMYRRLPAFLIATVDKFASLPLVGQVGVLLGGGSHTITAVFLGDANWNTASDPITIVVAKADLSATTNFSQVGIFGLPGAPYGGQLPTSSATLTAVGSGLLPPGSVTITSGPTSRPVQIGGRFAAKARGPSRASSEANTAE